MPVKLQGATALVKALRIVEPTLAKETTKEDILEFLEQLNQQQFEKIEEFFDAMPKMSKKIEMTCKKCGFHHELEAEGLESFFVF